MVEEPMANDIDLETFLKTAGQSFTDAQKELIPNIDVPVNMMISNAELELKVAVRSDAKGKMLIKLISSDEITRGDIDPGLLSTVRMTFVSSIGEIKTPPAAAPSTDTTTSQSKVPVLIGMTMDAAIRTLQTGKWQFEVHAAAGGEIKVDDKTGLGKVLRQKPTGGQSADVKNTIIDFWVDLGNITVQELEGIGEKYVSALAKAGIATVGEMSLATPTQIAAALHISESRARTFIDMAGLMSRLAILGFQDEAVELIVKGAGISSIQQLADSDPTDVFRKCQEAVSSGKVRIPRDYLFKAGEVKEWIKAANSYLGR